MKAKSASTWLRWAACFLAVGVSGVASAAIINTRHNLGSSQTITNANESSVTAEICVFCHTPHAASTTVTAPLWNKGTQNTSGYTLYNSSTMQATVGTPGAISLACLSCHDGTQAMDNVINAPGSGGYNQTGARFGGAANWTGTNQSGGFMTGLAALGTDLSNDHPIGMRYCGNATTGSAGCTDADFRSYTVAGSGGYVDRSGSSAGRDKTDMWIYNTGSGGLNVECASCHDPHSGNTTFLRVVNDNSAVCLACHIK